MVAGRQKTKLLAIVGPTASGKSELAMRIAQDFGGEIIAADSRTIYKGLDVGTAKPSSGDQKAIKHWGLDLVEPRQRFSAHQFQKYARQAIADIQKRDKLPILAGGTGLYIDATVYEFKFRPDADPKERKKLENLSIGALQAIILKNGYEIPVNLKNRRHLTRTIEAKGQKGTKQSKPPKNTLITGLMPPDEVLIKNIKSRVEKMFQSGLIEETNQLLELYGESILPSAGIGYTAAYDYIRGGISLEEAKKRFEQEHWQYSRRQKTWFRRNKFIQWFPDSQSAYEHIKTVLNK